ncbi:Gfo/Idh/MocA family oxidoreductase [Frigoribacterium sp. ACAM 257]|uniref:Gfo/Idh/MocA family protein n=1 Tax=Frigoribacterium sp. ACAM 257 TaxID=2508998 RepID=UPI0011B9C15A|nr:Gfo/Idh/MocA family oxidoreductase [Frigoribacterium sp. ACAM 257]TWX34132.1 Gfo/Idh/MocA family oxidoreductase [Frigoribacterium sp. ACAM 257]
MPSLRPIRVGMIGTAAVAPIALIAPAQKVSGVDVVAIADREPGRARAFASRHGIPHVDRTFEELLENPGVDAVYIAAAASHHEHLVTAAVRAGKHVLCEKPFTSNAGAAREVLRVAAASPGVVVMEAYHPAYHPLQQLIRNVLKSGQLGQITAARAVHAVPVISRAADPWKRELGGGGLLDAGYYPVRQLRELFGEPQSILDARAWSKGEVDRRFESRMLFAKNIQGSIVSSIWSRTLLASRLEVTGDNGALTVSWPYHPQMGARLTVRAGGVRRVRPIKRRSSYIYQLEAFRDAILTGARPLTSAADSVAQIETIDALYFRAGLAARPSRA